MRAYPIANRFQCSGWFSVTNHLVHQVSTVMHCETLGAAIYVDVNLSCATYFNIVANQVHHFMAMVFPDCSGRFQ